MRLRTGHNMKPRSTGWILTLAAMMAVVLIGVVAASGRKTSTPSPSASLSNENPNHLTVVPIAARHAFALQAGQAGGQGGQAGGQGARGRGASPPEAKGQMVEDVFKNVTVLTKMPVDEFMGTMGIFSAALSFCCAECHTGAGTDTVKWEFDTPRKVTARKMVEMVRAINRDNFGGRQVVTCWTCHRGRDRPVMTPTLETVYGTPNLEPDDLLTKAPATPAPQEVFDKYIKALGGAQRLNGITSFVAKGTSVGFGGFGGGRPVEIYAKAPDQRTTIMHSDAGDIARVFDGRVGWIMTPLTAVKSTSWSAESSTGPSWTRSCPFQDRLVRS